MKKMNLMILLATILVVTSSCKKDTTPPTPTSTIDYITYTGISMQSQIDSMGSPTAKCCLDVETGKTYDIISAAGISAGIDMISFHEEVMKLGSAGGNIKSIWTGTIAPSVWETTNTTFYTSAVMDVNFDGLTTSAAIKAAVSVMNPDRKMIKNGINAGDVYGFVLASGKYGLMKFTAIDNSSIETGKVTFDLKLEK